jgi:F-type H+-transporting ATPase subunit b
VRRASLHSRLLPLLFACILVVGAGLFLGAGLSAARAAEKGNVLRDSSISSRQSATGNDEQGEAEPEPPHRMLYKVINFLILVLALGYLLRKPLAEFFSQRSQSIRKSLEEGRKALAASQERLSAIEARLGNLEAEIRGFKESAGQEMEAERRRLQQAAAEEAERTLAFARIQIEVATRAAKLELKRYTALEAVGLAQEIIRQRLDEPGHKRLVSRFVEGLKGTVASG